MVVSAVLWLLLCRIAGTALMEEASDLEDPAEEKHRQLLGDPAAHTDKPTKSENLVRVRCNHPKLADATCCTHAVASPSELACWSLPSDVLRSMDVRVLSLKLPLSIP